MSVSSGHVHSVAARLTELTEELLDAHCDTLFLAEALSAEPGWAAHIDYLKDLQRVGQRALAELSDVSVEEPRPHQAELSDVSVEELRPHQAEPPHPPRVQRRLLARLRLPVGQLRRQ